MGNVKIISASAGSGKTYRLAYEYVKSVVADPDPLLYRRVLAVTFTNKATEEMRGRILERIHELASGAPSPYMKELLRDLAPLNLDEAKIRARAAVVQRHILHDYSRFAVLTIDRFFQRLIRSFIRELGVEVNFNLELETDSLLSLAADALIEETSLESGEDHPVSPAGCHPSTGGEPPARKAELRAMLYAAARERVDEGKSWNVKEPLLSLGKELFGEEYQRTKDRKTASSASGKFPSRGGGVAFPSEASRRAESAGQSARRPITGAVANATDGVVSPAPPTPPTLIESIVEKATAAQSEYTATARRALETITSAGLSADDFKGRSRSLVSYLTKAAGGGVGEFIPLSTPAHEAMESADPSAWTTKTAPNRGMVEALIPTLQPLLVELDAIHTASRRLVESARLLRENYRNFMLLTDLQRHVERICREENIMPIAETNRIIARLVEGNDTPFIFEKAGSYFTRFFIDEFQDTSSSQWDNFVPLLRNSVASEEGWPVMLIGDIKQAIYRWRGGDWQILSRRVHEDIGAGRVEAETLDTNYRSLPRVVEFNNAAVGLVTGAGIVARDTLIAKARTEGSLDADEAAELTGMLAEAYTDHTQKPKPGTDGGYVTHTVYHENETGEYIPPVIERIEELQSRGYRAGDIAVLVRSNTQGARVAQMLLARKHANPSSPYTYDVVTQEALTVGASAASRFIIACLSLSADPGDTIQRAVYNRRLCRAFDAPLPPEDTVFFARLATLSPEEAFEEIVMRFGLQSHTADIAYIQAVHQQIVSFSSRKVADIPLFLKWWEEKGVSASITMQGTGSNAITVSTIHKSKGLQYKVVIVPWLSWPLGPDTRGKRLVVWADGIENAGALPINYKDQMADSFFSARYYRERVLAYIDAVNLFYVAVTRAEAELHLMASSNPHDGKNSVGNTLRNVLNIAEDFTEWGAPLHPNKPETAPENHSLRTYPTSRPGAKVKLRLPSSRYTEGDAAPTLAPRDFGILMHRAFENAVGRDDVLRAVRRMSADGFISQAEHTRLQETIERAFANPLVAGWFSEEWSVVRNEGDILTPGDPSVKRPDRVMIRGDKAVVVDYKFGRAQNAAHAAQLRGYMTLLGAMGYTDVEGFLWYVSLDRIESVA